MALLQEVLANLCQKAGLAPSQVDLSLVTGTIEGFVVSNRASVRSSLEHLQRAFFLDIVESSGTIRFVPRGQAVAATIPIADLIPQGDGNSRELLTITRRQESELSQTLNVNYLSKGADYQQGTQLAQRQVNEAENASNVTVPIVMTADYARKVADVLLYTEWTERTSYRFALPVKYAYLEPGDVIDIVATSATHRIRLQKTALSGQQLRCEGFAEDGSVYNQSNPGGGDTIPVQVVPNVGDTTLLLLDIPILQDADDNAGFYLAVDRQENSSWRGATVYRSANTTDYGFLASSPVAATTGKATSVLLAGRTTLWDYQNTVTVELSRTGTLLSAPALDVLNGANAALLGDEIIQWQTAELIAPKTYRLSKLLRGRRGTEAALGTHALNERFVVLSSGTVQRIPDGLDLIGAVRSYKAVSAGRDITSATAANFSNTAKGLKPLSPVHLKGSRNGAGDLAITWKRRTRIGGGWRDNAEVPLGETSEAYEVEILNGASVLRTFTGTTPTVIYTATQQTSDFGSVQAAIAVRVYQLSATVGRGAPLEKTL
jgi:hypothetical protein